MNTGSRPDGVVHLACPGCHGLVRVPSARLGEQPRCPRCKAGLFEGRPVERTQPATYITSFHLPPDRLGLLAELARRFPSVTVIDVGGVLNQVRAMIERAALALEYVFAFTLVAG